MTPGLHMQENEPRTLSPNPDERDKCLSQIIFLQKKQENNL